MLLQSNLFVGSSHLTHIIEILFETLHGGEPAGAGTEIGSSPLAVGGGADQSGQGAPHEIAFDAAYSHERVRHCGSARVESVLRVGRGGGDVGVVLVEAAPEGAGVSGWGTHTGALRLTDIPAALDGGVVVVVAAGDARRDGDGSAGGGRAVEGESYGLGGGGRGGDAEARGGSGAVEEGGGAGGEAGSGGGEGGSRRELSALKPSGGWSGADDWPAAACRSSRSSCHVS
ncbi:unnamed protein product [Malus baccata var. baccata]